MSIIKKKIKNRSKIRRTNDNTIREQDEMHPGRNSLGRISTLDRLSDPVKGARHLRKIITRQLKSNCDKWYCANVRAGCFRNLVAVVRLKNRHYIASFAPRFLLRRREERKRGRTKKRERPVFVPSVKRKRTHLEMAIQGCVEHTHVARTHGTYIHAHSLIHALMLHYVASLIWSLGVPLGNIHL